MIEPVARPDVVAYFLAMARLVASRSTCSRRAVGCVLVDRRNRVLATGYNGPPAGAPHCDAAPCHAGGAPPASGTGLDLCRAVHAEVNAVTSCRDVDAVAAAYCTTRPCPSCAKVIVNTACAVVYYVEEYPGARDGDRLVPGIDRPRVVRVRDDAATSLIRRLAAAELA
jgi:dCMP deaminase